MCFSVLYLVSMDTLSIRDFCYVADYQPHKNHDNLLKAWDLLEEEGIVPSLALTIPKFCVTNGCKSKSITYHDQLDHKGVIELYQKSRSLIYPSKIESFGLPLIEASEQKPSNHCFGEGFRT